MQPEKNTTTLPTFKKAIRMTTDFSSKTMEVRRMWHNIFQVQNKKLSIQNTILSRNTFWNKDEIKTIEAKLRKDVASRPTLKEWLKEVV